MSLNTSRDLRWGGNCDTCEERLNAGRAEQCHDPATDSVICGSCRDEDRAAAVKDALDDVKQRLEDILACTPVLGENWSTPLIRHALEAIGETV